jgi:DNA-binding beta-propeller fold protein YncE
MDNAHRCLSALPLHQTIQAATEGEYRFVAKWGPPDLTRDGNVKNPTGIAVDTAGLVYVADRGNNRVQKFTSFTFKLI